MTKFMQILMLIIFLLAGNIQINAADKTIDYSAGSGSGLANITDGSNSVPDVSLDLSGAVDFVLDAGTSSLFTNYNDLVFDNIFSSGAYSAATAASGAPNGYGFSFYENSGTNFTFEEVTIFRTVNVSQAGDEAVTINGYENGALVATYSSTIPNGATFPGNVTYTRASDFNSDPDWQEVDSVTITFVEANSGDFLSMGINKIVVDDALSAVPVELTSFTALVNDNSVQLNWETATEVNNYGFEIERKDEQIASNLSYEWEKIGFVIGHGNSNSPKSYNFIDELSSNGDFSYRLKQIDFDGKFEYSDVVNVFQSIPIEFDLEQNYPNPFNPATRIRYSIPVESRVKITVYNTIGQLVELLENNVQSAGTYELNFDASSAGGRLSSGVYIYRMDAETIDGSKTFSKVNKMLLIK